MRAAAATRDAPRDVIATYSWWRVEPRANAARAATLALSGPTAQSERAAAATKGWRGGCCSAGPGAAATAGAAACLTTAATAACLTAAEADPAAANAAAFGSDFADARTSRAKQTTEQNSRPKSQPAEFSAAAEECDAYSGRNSSGAV